MQSLFFVDRRLFFCRLYPLHSRYIFDPFILEISQLTYRVLICLPLN